MSGREFARRTHHDERTIRDWLGKGQLEGSKFPGGRKWQIPASSLDRFLGATSTEQQQVSDQDIDDVLSRQVLAVTANKYPASHILLDPKDMARLYLTRWGNLPSRNEAEFLLHCWLAGCGPAWYWLRDIERSHYLSMLIAALENPVSEVRSGAAKAMGGIGTRAHISRLFPLLHDGPQVSIAVAKAIVQLNRQEDPALLLRLIERGSEYRYGVPWLWSIKDILVDAIVASTSENETVQLRHWLNGKENPDAQEVAVRALGKIGARKDLLQLIALLKSRDYSFASTTLAE